MESYAVEWLSLLGRWVHMITGIAWIGASFYFVWLDNHLQEPKRVADTEKGVSGEVWSVHGGGFYHAQKYRVAPAELPEKLNWFKWEAYTTWMSGMFLLALIYWYGAEIYLIDPGVADLSKPVAILIGMAVIVVGWFVYDLLCRSSVGQNDTQLAAALFVLVAFAAWGLCQLFSGRGAFIHFGAMLGTIMVANVFFVIIPGQGDLVSAKKEGREPDPIHGIRGKQRSVHNTYFTLPVLFVMISNHHAMTTNHQYNWLILIAMSLAGALIRVYFVKRHFGGASLLPLVVAVLLLLGVITALVPRPAATNEVNSNTTDSAAKNLEPTFANVQTVVQERCTGCHSAKPTQPGFYAPPKGIAFDTQEQIIKQAQTIHMQSVVTRAMPIGNLTAMTEQERTLLDRWYTAGVETK